MIAPANQVFDLSHFALLEISGADAVEFMHAQITADLHALDPEGWRFTAWCLPNGRVISTFILFRRDDSLYVLLPSMMKDKILQRLGRYILRARVAIREAGDDQALLGLAGPDVYPALNSMGLSVQPGGLRLDRLEGVSLLGLWGNAPRCILVCAIEKLSALSRRISMAFTSGDRVTWSLLDIESGIPWITEATSESFLPQMLNIDQIQGLSYQKGCYPGQEVVARLHYRGQLKRRLYLGTGTGHVIPGPGDRLERPDTGERVGDVIDAERHPDGGFRLLAVADITAAGSAPLSISGSPKSAVHLQTLTYPAP